MKLAPIIQQIQAECPVFTQVAGSITSDLDTAISQNNLPVAYVVRLDEDAEAVDDAGNEWFQELTEYFSVVVILSQEDPRGQLASDNLDDIRSELFRALLRWSPDETHDRIGYQGGELVGVDRERLIYAYNFRMYTTLNKDDTWQKVAYDRLQPCKGIDIDVDEIGPREHKPDGEIEAKLKIDF